MRLGFFGAAREVTGSCVLVETSSGNMLVDCGLIQTERMCEPRNAEPFAFAPSSIAAVIVTHAHLDHHGRLPRLFASGGRPRVYSTAATRDLAELMLEDALNIMGEEARRCGDQPLFLEEDLERTMQAWRPLALHARTELLPDVFVTLFNSGHILGSAFVLIEADGARVVVSGDVGNVHVPILAPTEALPTRLDLLVCESTYGNRLHAPTQGRLKTLREVVERVTGRGGVLMIPAFSIERTQEILFDLNTLVEHEGVHLRAVYLDSPLGIGATHLYERYKDELELKFPKDFSDDDFFQFRGLHITETVAQSKAINEAPSPKVIIAGAGMMNAGRIQHHLLRYLDDKKNGVLIVGYQGEGTLGRSIQDGAKTVTIFDYGVHVRAEVVTMDSYSAHADYDALTQWIVAGAPRRVALVHGDPPAQDALAAHLRRQGVDDVVTPSRGDWISPLNSSMRNDSPPVKTND